MGDINFNRKGNVYVDASDAVSGLYRFANFTRAACRSVAKEYATEILDYMQKNAPWNDITGKARKNLSAEYFEEGIMSKQNQFNVGVRLSHGVPYGKYLEYNGLYTPSYKKRRRPILVNDYEAGGVTSALHSNITKNFLQKLKAQFAKIAKV